MKEEGSVRRRLLLRIASIGRQAKQKFDQRVASLGVTRSKWTLIALVARFPGATQKTLAEYLEISEVSVGRLIERLIQEGTLARTPRDEDRRAYHIHLTESTKPLLDKLAILSEEVEEEFFAHLSDDELCQLDNLLAKVAQNLGGRGSAEKSDSLQKPADAL